MLNEKKRKIVMRDQIKVASLSAKSRSVTKEWLLAQRSRRLTSKGVGERTYSLFVADAGQHFIRSGRGGRTKVTPPTVKIAFDILLREKSSQIESLLKAKLKTERRGVIDEKTFNTTKDTLLTTFSSPIEAVALYQTATGDYYLRLVSPRSDAFFTFGVSDFQSICGLFEFWFGPYPMFRAFVDMLFAHATNCLIERPNGDDWNACVESL